MVPNNLTSTPGSGFLTGDSADNLKILLLLKDKASYMVIKSTYDGGLCQLFA